MRAMVRVRSIWPLAEIASAAGAGPSQPFGLGPTFVNDADESGWGVLTVPNVAQEALDAALAAWLEAAPQ